MISSFDISFSCFSILKTLAQKGANKKNHADKTNLEKSIKSHKQQKKSDLHSAKNSLNR